MASRSPSARVADVDESSMSPRLPRTFKNNKWSYLFKAHPQQPSKHHIPPRIHHVFTSKFASPFASQTQSNSPKHQKKPLQNPITHHNSPQTPATRFFHRQLAQPPLLTFPLSENPLRWSISSVGIKEGQFSHRKRHCDAISNPYQQEKML